MIHVAGPNSLRLAWQTHFVGHLRAVNNNFLDTYQLKSQNAVLDGTVERIERAPTAAYLVTVRFARADEVVKELRVRPGDRRAPVSASTPRSSTPECRPELVINDRFPAQTARVGVGQRARPVLRRHAHAAARLQEVHQRLHPRLPLRRARAAPHPGAAAPRRALAAPRARATPEAIGDAVLERVNRTSALWQQFAFLGDVVTVAGRRRRPLPRGGAGRLRRARPALGEVGDHFVVTLEYGPDHDKVDPFDITVAAHRRRTTRSSAHDAATCTRSSGATGGRRWSPSTTWPRTWRTSGTCRRCTARRWPPSSRQAGSPAREAPAPLLTRARASSRQRAGASRSGALRLLRRRGRGRGRRCGPTRQAFAGWRCCRGCCAAPASVDRASTLSAPPRHAGAGLADRVPPARPPRRRARHGRARAAARRDRPGRRHGGHQPVADVVAAARSPRRALWFQLYLQPDLEVTDDAGPAGRTRPAAPRWWSPWTPRSSAAASATAQRLPRPAARAVLREHARRHRPRA